MEAATIWQRRLYFLARTALFRVLVLPDDPEFIDEQQYTVWHTQHSSLLHQTLWNNDGLLDALWDTSDRTALCAGLPYTAQLGLEWSTELQRAAELTHQQYPYYDRATWLYYHYCSSLHNTLHVFEQLLSGSLLACSTIYLQYQHYAPSITALSAFLQNELAAVSADIRSRLLGEGEALADQWCSYILHAEGCYVEWACDQRACC